MATEQRTIVAKPAVKITPTHFSVKLRCDKIKTVIMPLARVQECDEYLLRLLA
jgi:hypothetical protein